MAVSNQTIWEVRSGGNDTNGGGFVSGASGTDFSQQTAAQISVTDAVAVGTTTVTSLTASFAASSVGNIIYLQGGTGSLAAGWYQVVSFTNSTTIVVDRNVATGTGITLHLGGAFVTIQKGLDQLIDSQIVYVKAATYSISAVLTIPSITPSNYYTRIIGYTTTRGDNGQPTVSQTAAANGINMNQQGVSLQNFIFDGTTAGTIGINIGSQYDTVSNCVAKNWTSYGINLQSAATTTLYKCEITANAGTYGLAIQSGEIAAYYCYIHNNTNAGVFSSGGDIKFVSCVIANNGGIGLDGDDIDLYVTNCLFYNNTGDGFKPSHPYSMAIGTVFTNCIFAKNGGYGINASSNGTPNNSYPWIQYNGFWNNTTAAVNNVTLDSTNVQISGTGSTNDPFVNDGSQNWQLNNTAGAGALLRVTGFPGQLPGLTTSTGYADIGPFQHQDSTAPTVGSTFVMA